MASASYAKGALFGLAAVSLWAGNIVVAGLGLRSNLTPWDIAAIRFGVAGLVLLPYLIRRGLALDRLGWLGVATLVLGGAPTVLLVNAGLLFAPASQAGALFPGVMPMMVGGLAAILLKEPFTPRKKVGFALIATGVVAIVWVSGGTIGTTQTLGHLLFLGAALAFACYTDHTNQELPPKFTMLYAVAVPDKGGATSVCNARDAYEALPDEVKLRIADAKTENTLISSARMKTGNPDIVKAQRASTKPPTVHPLVRTHPETGTKAVRFHKAKTETVTGMSPEETQDFLQDLTDKVTQPQFCYAHEYQKGDLLIIDDRASMHKAGFDYDHSQHRRLYRMLVRGDRPY